VAAAHLLPQAELERIAEQVFRASDADETEVLIEAVTDALTRFANNTIHQNVAEQAVHVSVRTVYDGRTARAATNRTDAESLRRVAAASSALASSRSIPTCCRCPGRSATARFSAFFRQRLRPRPKIAPAPCCRCSG
jgi:hypothetical protein